MNIELDITTPRRLEWFLSILPSYEVVLKAEADEDAAYFTSLTREDAKEGARLAGLPLAAVDALLANTVDKLPEPPTTFPPGLTLGPQPEPTRGQHPEGIQLPTISLVPAISDTLASPPATSIDFSKLGPTPAVPLATSPAEVDPSDPSAMFPTTSPSETTSPLATSLLPTASAGPAAAGGVEPTLPLGLPPMPSAPDFEVFLHTGEKKAGYAHAKDALTVLQGLVADTDTNPALAQLESANASLRERFDRGEKSSFTRAFTRRREELAEIEAIMNGGGAPATVDRPALSTDEFRIRIQTLASKAGIQAFNAVLDHFSPETKKLIDIPADKYWAAIDALQVVVDNKGK